MSEKNKQTKETKHTPGPWIQERYTARLPGGDVIADCRSRYLDDSILLANARLISAAPDLLEVAKGCLGYLENIPDLYSQPDEAWLAPLRAAIAKAEGRE
jgi:hypothetical protein